MTYMKTDLEGKVRNLPQFKTEALLPVFEALVNSIHAIEEAGNQANAEISIEVVRDDADLLDEEGSRAINGFIIKDNGIGFNDENLSSFETSDSTYKKAKGGKGIGRFLWLKAFENVRIDSVFANDGKKLRRTFAFNTMSGISPNPVPAIEVDAPQQTTVHLEGFKDEYRKLPTAYKTKRKIEQRILEHCLSYFIANTAPRIKVIDGDESTTLNDLYKNEIDGSVERREIKIEGIDFTFSHIKLYSTHAKMHNIALCANGRDVKAISLTKALGTSTHFDENDRKFVYAIYVASPYLDQHVSSHRLEFEIPEEAPLFDGSNIKAPSMKQIIKTASDAAKEFLSDHLQKSHARKEEIVSSYIEHDSPSLRAVPTYCPEIYDELEPTSSPEKINEVLYRHKGRAEYEIRKRSSALIKTQASSLEELDEEYRKLMAEITDFQRDSLVGYLCDRKKIIDLLERKLELNTSGKFSNEDVIHDIIFPRKSTTDQLLFEDHNLWLVDESLVFHNFAASDKPLNQISGSPSDERPDVVAFAEIDEDKIARAVSILEFKKPQRTNFDEDPTRQLYRYLREIRDGKKIKLPNGRDINVGESTKYYCYAICDLTPAIHTYAENDGNYARIKGELGYYKYNRSLNAHTEILAFDKIVADARRRHKAFFEKLGIA